MEKLDSVSMERRHPAWPNSFGCKERALGMRDRVSGGASEKPTLRIAPAAQSRRAVLARVWQIARVYLFSRGLTQSAQSRYAVRVTGMARLVAFIKLGRPKFLVGGFLFYGLGAALAAVA